MTRPQIAAITIPVFILSGAAVATLAKMGGDALGFAFALLVIVLVMIAASHDMRSGE